MKPANPYISVIIGTYYRKEYIRDAIESVFKQDMPREDYELIVFRSFKDKEIDSYLLHNNAVIIESGLLSIGEIIAKSIEAANGDVICFLDDDDIFEPGKLSKVNTLFKKNENLFFYHNNQTFCDKVGNPIIGFKRKKSPPPYIEFQNSNFKELYNKMEADNVFLDSLWFNLSSISVRKNIFSGKLDMVKKITGHSDDLMFFLTYSLPEKVSLINDVECLTIYRLHNSTTNLIGNVDSALINTTRIKQYQEFAESSKVYTELMKDTDMSEYVKARYLYDLAMWSNTKKDAMQLIVNTKDLLACGGFRLIEYSIRKRAVIYFSYIGFSIFYFLSKRAPVLKKLSLLFPNVESFQR